MTLDDLRKDFRVIASPSKAKLLQRYFKTGKGEYGEGDIFLGITVPNTRKVAKKYYELTLNEIQKLLDSKYHEERLCALLILNEMYEKAEKEKDIENKKKIFEFYLKNTNRINNWDLVDTSAHKIVGRYLENKDKKILYNLAKSDNLWERRISIISCFWFIKNKDFNDALKLAEMHLLDKEDLMHKAVGWMLREIGKKEEKVLKNFLDKNYLKMPRTSLRYAIERLPKETRARYLARVD